MNIESHIDLVKDQVDFHEKQAARFEAEPKRAARHLHTAQRFRALLTDLATLAERAGNDPNWAAPTRANQRLGLSWEEIEGLPVEVLMELSISDSDRTEFAIQSAIEELGGVASLDRLIVYLFKSTGEIFKRTPLNQRLYRMCQKDMVYSVPGKKGVYSLAPITEEQSVNYI